MDCKTCKEKDRQDTTPVTRYAFEATCVSFDKTVKKLWIIIILLIVLLFGTNAAWIYYESQWEVVETYQNVEQEADGNGMNKFIGGNYYGNAESADLYEDADS